MTKAGPYISGKQKIHGFKTEASVLLNGICISLPWHAKGKEADVGILSFAEEAQKCYGKIRR